MTRGSSLWLSLALVAMTAPPASAQRTVELGVGTRIRVRTEADSSWRVGRLVGASQDTIRFQACDACAVATYALSTTTVEVSVARIRDNSTALNGGGLGLLLGAGAGALLAYQATRNCHEGPCGIAYVAVPIGAIAGFFLGATAGSVIRYEDWEPAPIR